jgi:hypothetical protein
MFNCLICMFRSLCSVYCLCVNVHCTTANGCQPNLQFYGYIQWNLGSRTPLITNKSVHEQIFRKKKYRVTNGVSSNKHASRQQRLATSWEYRRESVSCCVTFAQYTSLLKFAVPYLEFHCVVCFCLYIIK